MLINAMLMMMPLLLATAPVAQALSPLIGTWTEINGPGAARIAACAKAPDRFCAVGLARRTSDGAARVETGTVLSDVAVTGLNQWRGTYHDGKRLLPATLRMIDRDVVEMKVCIFVLCQSARYRRDA